MSSVPSHPHLPRRATIQEYLQAEATSVEKHEYRDGWIVQMQGGTYEHSRINFQFGREVSIALGKSPCFVLESNMRLRIDLANKYCYPDSMVVCGAPEFDVHDSKRTTIRNPRVVVEVHSASSIGYDRGQKFNDYILVPGLEEVVLVWQEQPRVDTFVRQPDGTWSFAYAAGADARVTLRSLGVNVPLAAVYDGIEFPPPPDTAGTVAAEEKQD